ncbi:AMP-binding protein [Glaciimonas sp. PCH181]|uniref:AMP-binding protein n=1 Tax=Glaciimonas sp. PCH181 TaxID=2133943 RepID=UPI000D35C089|nr:AMP-binding protein [Glaciimonas sp. PCH181]PUA17722.1 ATP-dependent acyl-CoA ligase [Glaciimonas sp. PCH181]
MLQTDSICQSLPNILADRASSHPETTFIRTVDGEAVTYAAMEGNVRTWTETLSRAGVGASSNVLVMLPNSVESITVWMAIARLSAVEVPINSGYLGNMLSHVVNDCGARCLVVHARYLDRFEEIKSDIPNVETIIVVGDLPETGNSFFDLRVPLTKCELPPLALPQLASHDLACIVYTSGTTGPSKGVMMSWRQLIETARWCIPIEDLTSEDIWYCPWQLYHVSGKLSVVGTAMANATLVLRETFSTSQFWDDIKRFGCTTTMLVGSTILFLEAQPPSAEDKKHPLRNVYVCPLPSNPNTFMERFGVRLCTAFNMTETSCPIVTGWQLGPGDSCGRPRPGVQCRIVDDHDEEVPVGTVGELLIRTEHPWELMSGYWNRPAATTEVWRNQWLHTGDAFKCDAEGNYFFVDRMKYAIRRRGENVSSTEVEMEVNAHPDVAESAAIGVPSEWGEEDIKVFVVTKNGEDIDPVGLIEFLSARVPRFMLPRYIVSVSEIPKTHTFRAKKEELRSMKTEHRTWDRSAQ